MDPLTGSLIVGGLSQGINALSTIGQNKANRKLTKEMFNMTNAYNTPLAQVERLKKAGLNPALMYQGSPQNVSQQPSAPKQEAPQLSPTLFADIFSKMKAGELAESKTIPQAININLGELAVKQAGANVANTEQMTETGKQTAIKLASEYATIQQKYKFDQELFETNKSYQQEQLKNLEQQNNKLGQELKVLPEQLQTTIQQLKANLEQTVRQTGKLDLENWVLKNDQELRKLYVNPQGSNMVDTILRYLVGNGANILKSNK